MTDEEISEIEREAIINLLLSVREEFHKINTRTWSYEQVQRLQKVSNAFHDSISANYAVTNKDVINSMLPEIAKAYDNE